MNLALKWRNGRRKGLKIPFREQRSAGSSPALSKLSKFPTWLCAECASKFGSETPNNVEWLYGKCCVCQSNKSVTSPRDFGLP